MQKKFQDLYRKQNKIYVTTSGISNIEKECIRKEFPSNFIIEDVMTTATSYLFVYRCTFTDKYIQALKWRIPIVHIQYLYNVEDSISKFLLLPFEGSNFTTSMISNDMFKNFYVLQGGKYKQDIDYNTDFLVTDSEGDKKEYATKYDIPIIPCTDVFLNNYRLYKRNSDVVILEADDFANLTFYLDKNLPTLLFNTLKRKIIEGNGLRVPVIDKEVDFVITSPILYDSIIEKIDKRDADYFEDRILHYQYIFDCVERKKIIKHEFYTINKVTKKGILKNCVCCIDKSLEASKHAVTNKIIALGGIVKENARSGITHLVIKNKKEYTSNTRKKLPYKVVMAEWIDQCLYNIRFMNEEKYIYRKPVLELQKAKSAPLFVKSRVTYAQEDDKEILFQFTGLSPSLKSRAIEILSKYQIRYIDSDRFEGCTHLIMGLLCTSEKFMCSVAKGNWILIPDFINDFDGSNAFDFSKYEWTVDENTDEKHVKLVKSIKKWRETVISTKNGAFYGWVVKFECEDNKKASLTSLIISGGGQVTESDAYTHIFVSKKYLKDYSGDKCFSINYLYSYLFTSKNVTNLTNKYK